jgi:phosphate starvation-inducible PhoH-like protein
VRRTVELSDTGLAREVLGTRDRHLRRVREAMQVTAVLRGGRLIVEGEPEKVELATAAVKEIRRVARALGGISGEEVDRIVEGALGGPRPREREAGEEGEGAAGGRRPGGLRVGRGRSVEPRTAGQGLYVETMRANDVVFAVGPAGTGKTYLAVAVALAELEAGRVNRICLARPAVEAGERLGFLPGDPAQKVNPYLRPLYDALQDMMSIASLTRLLDRGVVEVVPLAYMRGRTLGHAFVILDEAQNTTPGQMLMFLTRLGLESKAVVTGDVTQVDIPDPEQSGMLQAIEILDGVEGIGFVHLSQHDIVRHRLVRKIVDRWSRAQEARRAAGGRPSTELAPEGSE